MGPVEIYFIHVSDTTLSKKRKFAYTYAMTNLKTVHHGPIYTLPRALWRVAYI